MDSNQTRRDMIRKLTFGALGGVAFANLSCTNRVESSVTETNIVKSLSPVLTKAGTTVKAADGIDFGFKIRSNQTNGQFSCTENASAKNTWSDISHA